MKRIVICFDGTWNKPAEENLPVEKQVETNVCRFYESVAERGGDGVQQLKWYDEGVGSKWYDKFLGGTVGLGLELNIMQGYDFLAKNYQDGDEVYVLGFSRGAYTARSLVGLVRNCGLIKTSFLGTSTAVAYGIYRTRDDGPDSSAAKFFKSMFSRDIKIKFVGVWDTVGALGIPIQLLNMVNAKFYEFHDTQLSKIVENAYHAVAIDEHRLDFQVCLWDPKTQPEQKMEQRWFIGAHCDIGGGYPDRRLSDIALGWMQDKASALGLGVKRVGVTANNYQGEPTDSYAQFLKGIYAKRNPRHFRKFGVTRFGNETLDETVQKRRKEDREYEPQNDGLPKLV